MGWAGQGPASNAWSQHEANPRVGQRWGTTQLTDGQRSGASLCPQEGQSLLHTCCVAGQMAPAPGCALFRAGWVWLAAVSSWACSLGRSPYLGPRPERSEAGLRPWCSPAGASPAAAESWGRGFSALLGSLLAPRSLVRLFSSFCIQARGLSVCLFLSVQAPWPPSHGAGAGQLAPQAGCPHLAGRGSPSLTRSLGSSPAIWPLGVYSPGWPLLGQSGTRCCAGAENRGALPDLENARLGLLVPPCATLHVLLRGTGLPGGGRGYVGPRGLSQLLSTRPHGGTWPNTCHSGPFHLSRWVQKGGTRVVFPAGDG
ncbi:uncharacterized protein LOC125616823 [Marmota marmota marmota]|uniref:uncharacterized protein LOC125616823 n=1 Tax=Marmota marmota marmota TaxID=9994 RepID=UPI00209350DF|nr:uncharacterized protein LOC125616823 [Marmota marmota marmota]XP_048659068.1 uncharacterized protein LOC125616823 [Marmota marmota marmota]